MHLIKRVYNGPNSEVTNHLFNRKYEDPFDNLITDKSLLLKNVLLKPTVRASYNRDSSIEYSYNECESLKVTSTPIRSNSWMDRNTTNKEEEENINENKQFQYSSDLFSDISLVISPKIKVDNSRNNHNLMEQNVIINEKCSTVEENLIEAKVSSSIKSQNLQSVPEIIINNTRTYSAGSLLKQTDEHITTVYKNGKKQKNPIVNIFKVNEKRIQNKSPNVAKPQRIQQVEKSIIESQNKNKSNNERVLFKNKKFQKKRKKKNKILGIKNEVKDNIKFPNDEILNELFVNVLIENSKTLDAESENDIFQSDQTEIKEVSCTKVYMTENGIHSNVAGEHKNFPTSIFQNVVHQRNDESLKARNITKRRLKKSTYSENLEEQESLAIESKKSKTSTKKRKTSTKKRKTKKEKIDVNNIANDLKIIKKNSYKIPVSSNINSKKKLHKSVKSNTINSSSLLNEKCFISTINSSADFKGYPDDIFKPNIIKCLNDSETFNKRIELINDESINNTSLTSNDKTVTNNSEIEDQKTVQSKYDFIMPNQIENQYVFISENVTNDKIDTGIQISEDIQDQQINEVVIRPSQISNVTKSAGNERANNSENIEDHGPSIREIKQNKSVAVSLTTLQKPSEKILNINEDSKNLEIETSVQVLTDSIKRNINTRKRRHKSVPEKYKQPNSIKESSSFSESSGFIRFTKDDLKPTKFLEDLEDCDKSLEIINSQSGNNFSLNSPITKSISKEEEQYIVDTHIRKEKDRSKKSVLKIIEEKNNVFKVSTKTRRTTIKNTELNINKINNKSDHENHVVGVSTRARKAANKSINLKSNKKQNCFNVSASPNKESSIENASKTIKNLSGLTDPVEIFRDSTKTRRTAIQKVDLVTNKKGNNSEGTQKIPTNNVVSATTNNRQFEKKTDSKENQKKKSIKYLSSPLEIPDIISTKYVNTRKRRHKTDNEIPTKLCFMNNSSTSNKKSLRNTKSADFKDFADEVIESNTNNLRICDKKEDLKNSVVLIHDDSYLKNSEAKKQLRVSKKSRKTVMFNSFIKSPIAHENNPKNTLILQSGKWRKSLSLWRRLQEAEENNLGFQRDYRKKSSSKYHRMTVRTSEFPNQTLREIAEHLQESLSESIVLEQTDEETYDLSGLSLRDDESTSKDRSGKRLLSQRSVICTHFNEDPEFSNQKPIQRRRRTSIIKSSAHFAYPECPKISIDIIPELNSRDIVLRRCRQSEPLDFNVIYSESSLQNCRKIGEGVYGEVFMNKTSSGDAVVLKIIPIEGKIDINGESQKKFDEILTEIVIAMELSNLKHGKDFMTQGFVDVIGVKCVQGRYPEHLIDLWELYRDNRGTDNDHPEIFTDDQLYIILELANGGQDLEAFNFNNALQSYSAFIQTALSLAVAEHKYQFEHRDLHWGNILLSATDEKEILFKLNGEDIKIPSYGVKVSIIDYTLSRMIFDGCIFYNDLSTDDELFSAGGDYQFDIYRFMKSRLDNIWERYEPYTNILWLHYTIDKMINGARYRCPKNKKHRAAIQDMMQLRDELLDYKSSSEYVKFLN